MATLIPSYSTCSQRMTSGERRLAQRLEVKLEDDYLLWYNVPIGRQRLYPDFVVMHPWRGVIVLEVKDWRIDTLQSLNRDTATILTPNGTKTVENPLEQARGYALAIANQLEQDPLLIQGTGRYAGKLTCPYSYGLVLPFITRKQFEVNGLGDVLEPNLVICRDDMVEGVDALMFQQRLWNLCTYSFGEPLTLPQIDRIRWHLFPEVRIGVQLSLLPDEPPEQATMPLPDLMRVMDLQQEQLARSLGDGHRVIHGVAGSGKTLILVYRCLKLARELSKPVLVLCFNKALAARLRHLMSEKGILESQVSVCSFHRWCMDLLRQYRLPVPNYNKFKGQAYSDELVQRVIEAVNQGKIPAGSYGAVLIDEGHDFQPDWFKLTVQMVDPTINSLLLLYDDAQNLYGKESKRGFSFKSLGIQAQGRTTILKINYRNTEEILSVAYRFAKEFLERAPVGTDGGDLGTDGDTEDSPMLVLPETAGRHGTPPVLLRLPSFQAEAEHIATAAQRLHDDGVAWGDMAVVYRVKWMAEKVDARLQKAGILVEWVNHADKQGYSPDKPSIKLVTMHSSKGLEFPVVFIPGLGYLPHSQEAPTDEARLMDVAMTRAIAQLVMMEHQGSAFMRRLERVVGKR